MENDKILLDLSRNVLYLRCVLEAIIGAAMKNALVSAAVRHALIDAESRFNSYTENEKNIPPTATAIVETVKKGGAHNGKS